MSEAPFEPDFCVCDYRPRRKCSVHPGVAPSRSAAPTKIDVIRGEEKVGTFELNLPAASAAPPSERMQALNELAQAEMAEGIYDAGLPDKRDLPSGEALGLRGLEDARTSPAPPSGAAPPSEREAAWERKIYEMAWTFLSQEHRQPFKQSHTQLCGIIREAARAIPKAETVPAIATRIYKDGCYFGKEASIDKWAQWIAEAHAAVPQAVRHPELRGTWPENCVQRAFVEGAKWWEFYKVGATMWQSDQRLAEKAAVEQYGHPEAAAVPAPGPERQALEELLEWLENDTLEIMKDTMKMAITFDQQDCQLLREHIEKAWKVLRAGATAPPKEGK